MVSRAYSRLIQLAAKMVRGEGVPREFDEGNFYASTPMAERRRIVAAINNVEETHKQWATELRVIADEISAQSRLETPPEHVCGLRGFGAHGDVCPACSTANR